MQGIDNQLPGNKNVFFVGAGISANPPTNFPMAGAITWSLLEAIASDQETLKVLTELADSERPNKRNPGDYIRFELLLDVIQLVADNDLELLRFVDIFEKPNALHLLLAQRAMAGDVVITTNFDCLIEESIRLLGGNPLSLCSNDDFANWRQLVHGKTPVYKIHGSFRRYDESTIILTPETIQATLSTVTAGVDELMLPETKRDFLIDVTRDSSLIVAGYSGGDDLDIVPTFNLLSPARLMWLVHSSDTESQEVTEQKKLSLLATGDAALSTRDRVFKNQLSKTPSPIAIWQVNTPKFLQERFASDVELTAQPITGFAEQGGKSAFLTFLDEWKNEFLRESHVRRLIEGHLLFSLSRFEESYQLYLQAWSDRPLDTASAESANVARMISRLAVETGRFTEAENWAKRAVDDSVTPASSAQSLQQHGYCLIKLGNLDEALRQYDRAEVVCREHHLDRTLAYVLHDKGIIYQTLSQFDKAISLYDESIPLSRADGDIRHVMFSFHQMGTASYDLGKFKEATEYHLRAMDLAVVTGDYSQISNSEHELGMLDFLSGRLPDSIKRFRRGINIARKTGRLEYLAMDLQHIAITLMEAEKIRSAERLLLKAKQAYDGIGDEFTVSELQAYLSQCYLQKGEIKKATDAAAAGVAMAQREHAQEYLTRCYFMGGAAAYLAGDWTSGSSQIHQAIIKAHDERFMALLLDQLYLCARFGLSQLRFDELNGLISWALSTYKALGNEWRGSRIQTFRATLKQL